MLKQNTPEWLEMRKNKIGASDAPPIMGVSPYKTAYQIWEEKLGLASDDNQTWATKRGHDLEDQARQELEKMTGLLFLPQVKFHRSIPWMMASIDCIDPEEKYIGEIKCPNKEDHAIAQAGQVPDKYFPQLQHQLEVCELEMGYYFSFHEMKGVLVKIYRDDKYIKQMIEKEKQFWDCLQEFSPPEMTEKDYIPKTDPSWITTASEWKKVNEQLKLLEAQEKQLRSTIISMSEKKNSTGGGIKVTRSVRPGVVDYKSIPELKNVHLDKYRKNPIESYRISAL